MELAIVAKEFPLESFPAVGAMIITRVADRESGQYLASG